jgi:hypothetical protein
MSAAEVFEERLDCTLLRCIGIRRCLDFSFGVPIIFLGRIGGIAGFIGRLGTFFKFLLGSFRVLGHIGSITGFIGRLGTFFKFLSGSLRVLAGRIGSISGCTWDSGLSMCEY